MSNHESDSGTLAGCLRAGKPDVEILREVVDYDPDTGGFQWKLRPADHFQTDQAAKRWNGMHPGSKAGSLSPEGYLTITVARRNLKAHRVAWAIYYGSWPEGFLDHVNGVRSDNRICNLRQASRTENNRNARLSKANTSGAKGVYWVTRKKRWQARIYVGKRLLSFGHFVEKADAIQAVRAARESHHGEFANHG